MPWHRTLSVVAVAATIACGSTTSAARPSPSPTPSPSTAPASPSPQGPCAVGVASGLPPLMAVLESKASGSEQTIDRPLLRHDTLAIAGLNAVARARASFQPRAMPYIGNAVTLLSPREAYVVHGLVYYIDGVGTVWTMGADGKQTSVARFPIGLNQQEVSFAVSPDGCDIAAAVLTIPPKGPPPSGEPFPTLNGTWKLETMEASVRGTTQVLHSWTSTNYPGGSGGFANVTMVGWDATGPLVVIGAPLGTQNLFDIDNPDFFGGSVAHLDPQGVPTPPAPMPGGCAPLQITPAGDITCAVASSDGQTISIAIVSTTGQVEVQPFPVSGLPDVAIGPGGWVALTGLWRKGGATGALPLNFQPEGWVDANTIFGRIGDQQHGSGNAALAHLSGSSSTIENLGFVGDFVGMLS